ncbi:hypothetical protein [Brevibacillus porteri]|uniref:hypothetical protein n=1 Tax=Brevibacillus porteri TaxID=2126350 RepID=UPI00364392F5
MDLTKISNGLIVKNYKEMCNLLNVKAKTGNAKLAQLNEWKRFFSYRKEGNKFIIEQIYNEPLDKTLKRGGARNFLPHSVRMDRILMYLLNQEDKDDELFLPMSLLLKEMNMINDNYNFGNLHRKKVSKLLNIEEATVGEFFDLSKRNFKSNIESMLNRLEGRSLIYWTKVKTVCVANVLVTKNDFGDIKAHSKIIIDDYDNEHLHLDSKTYTYKQYRAATNNEIELILEVESKIMEELKCSSKQELITKKKWKTFIAQVNQILFDKANIIFYYDSYKIIRNKERLTRQVELIQSWINDELEYTIESNLLNMDTQKQIDCNLKGRHEEAKEKVGYGYNDDVLKRRAQDSYLQDGSTMIKTFINMNQHNIKSNMMRSKRK